MRSSILGEMGAELKVLVLGLPTVTNSLSDFLLQLLVVDPSERLGCDSQGLMAIKKHPWFQDINWDKLLAGSFEVPAEIASRVQLAFDFLPVDDGYQVFGLQPDEENPPWLDGW